jgi:large subunit ribosomal protein L10
MNRQEKHQWIENFRSSCDDSSIMIVVHYKGLNVKEMTKLRSKVRECGAKFKVTKNSLAKLAIAEGDFSGISESLIGPTAIAHSSDPVAVAKVISEFSKDNEKLVLVTGIFNQSVLSSEQIKELAKLPSLDELRSKIISLLLAPATKLAVVTKEPAAQLARLFNAYGTANQ